MSSENQVGAFMGQVRTAADKKFGRTPFELNLDGAYADVVFRLGKVLPLHVMLDWFSSRPNETGGKAKYPYKRIDINLVSISDLLKLIEIKKKDREKRERYEQASIIMAKILTWIDIGWNGIENFASNPDATRSWTTGPGHFRNGEERARYIVSEGRIWINQVV